MANDKLDISAISYTNKDFRSIYPEMLDLAKQLTNKWDPSKSNESDPGVVLLKEAAFVADHNNYNIDKNILENFLPSATQDISVRNITEMNGYVPRYYVSANGEVTLQWNVQEADEVKVFTIPAFTLVISDPEHTVSYTQTSDILVSEGSRATGWFIEGTLQQLSINDNGTIHLENLDDNNRIYFPESMVAQNGIYIKNVNSEDYNDYWTRDNYLLTRPVGSRVYKVDYDSTKNLPYIEFPSDISSLIGDGLQIQYISTSGEAGNISANTLTTIVSPSEFIVDSFTQETKKTENFSVWNAGAITNGKDPETINEMYNSFKKIVGTFDTLVTCNDYSNKIYTLSDFYDNNYVSNVYVTDRRTDYNNAANVLTYDIDTGNNKFKNISLQNSVLTFKGPYFDNPPTNANNGDMYYDVVNQKLKVWINGSLNVKDSISLNDFAAVTSTMTPCDLIIYGLKVFSISDYLDNNPAYSYNKSFTPIDSLTLSTIESEIEDNKCLCHTYKYAKNGDVFCFKNYVPLKVMIWTYNKIYESQKDEILKNIYKALQTNFNPRQLNFGEELDVDSVKKVIIESDSRIRDIDLEYEYNLNVMNGDGNDYSVLNDSNLMVDMVSKNVLAGRLCLFEFNDDFNFNYGQINGTIIDSSKNSTLKTSLEIEISDKQVEKYSTSDVKRTSTILISSGSNYQYSLKLAETQQDFSFDKGKAYILQKGKDGKPGDIFTIYITDSSGDIIKDSDIVFESKDNTSYTLSNQLAEAIDAVGDRKYLPSGELTIIEDVVTTSTNEGILNLDYTLNENEAIQIINPNYYSENTYTTYVNYRYIAPNGNDFRINANTEHTLKAGEKIVLLYSKDGESSQDVLTEGQIVRTSFNLVPTDELSANGVKKDWTDPNTGTIYVNANFRQLASNQTIALRKAMTTVLNSSGIWCYWITDDATDNRNSLFKAGEKERILRSNEYFIYTNSNLDEMLILGSGTMLKRTDDNDSFWTITDEPKDITTISREGVTSDIPWKKSIDFINNNLTITEMNVTTLGEGDRIIIYDWDNPLEKIGNTFEYCNGSIRYMIAGSETVLPAIKDHYMIRSRLDINCSKEYPQRLYTTNNSTQSITYNGVEISSDDEHQIYIQLSEPTGALGDTIYYEGKIFKYELKKDDRGYIESYPRTIVIKESGGKQEFPFFHKGDSDYMIPIHIKGIACDGEVEQKSDRDIKGITAYFINNSKDGDEIKIKDFNSETSSDVINLKGNSSYYLTPDISDKKERDLVLVIEYPKKSNQGEDYSSDQVITIGNISVSEGLNSEIKIPTIKQGTETKDPEEAILERISSIINNSDNPELKFNYTYQPDNSIAMDNTDFTDSLIAWDINNIINSMTIPQIDFNNSEFNFRKSMVIKDKQ